MGDFYDSLLARKEIQEERRAYLGSVLARAEAESAYRPARKLSLRVARLARLREEAEGAYALAF